MRAGWGWETGKDTVGKIIERPFYFYPEFVHAGTFPPYFAVIFLGTDPLHRPLTFKTRVNPDQLVG
jgi:hypothetical protein